MRDSRDWTPEDRAKAMRFHDVFDNSDNGKLVLADLRAELYDVPSAFARDRSGVLVMVSQRDTDVNEGKRAAFALILGYLEAYDKMTMEG